MIHGGRKSGEMMLQEMSEPLVHPRKQLRVACCLASYPGIIGFGSREPSENCTELVSIKKKEPKVGQRIHDLRWLKKQGWK